MTSQGEGPVQFNYLDCSLFCEREGQSCTVHCEAARQHSAAQCSLSSQHSPLYSQNTTQQNTNTETQSSVKCLDLSTPQLHLRITFPPTLPSRATLPTRPLSLPRLPILHSLAIRLHSHLTLLLRTNILRHNFLTRVLHHLILQQVLQVLQVPTRPKVTPRHPLNSMLVLVLTTRQSTTVRRRERSVTPATSLGLEVWPLGC